MIYLVTGGRKESVNAGFVRSGLKQWVQRELIERVQGLRKVKGMLDYAERSQRMREIGALSGLMERYEIDCRY